jgi:NitT/TauT family transport system substrate-binding protein
LYGEILGIEEFRMKKLSMAAAVIVLAALIFFACGTSGATRTAGEPYVVRFAYNKIICHAPLHAAILQGYFEAEGLRYETIELGDVPGLNAAVLEDRIDAGYGSITKFVAPMEQGVPYLVTSGIHTGCSYLVARYDSPINSAADLRGKKIGVTDKYDTVAIALRNALEKAGVGGRDDNLGADLVVYPKAADIAAAFEAGEIDAYHLGDPQRILDVEAQKVKVVIDYVGPDHDWYCCITFVTEKFAREHPEEARKYTRAVLKATEWLDTHQEELTALEVQEGLATGDPAVNARIIRGYDYLPSVLGGYKAFVDIVDDIDRLGLLAPTTDKYELIRTHYFKVD